MLYLAIVVYLVPLILAIQYFINRIAATKSFNAYYKEKRKQFPWLDNWIKDNKVKPASTRANSAANSPLFWIALAYIIIAFIGGYIANFIIGGLTSWILDSANVTPPKFIEALYMYVGQFAAIVAAVIVAQRMWNQHVKNPDAESQVAGQALTLECPKCHCPHSYVQTFCQYTVTGKTTTTETTTYVRESDGDTKRYESKKVEYKGTSIQDFVCLNCNHKHRAHNNNVYFGNERPNEAPVNYNPPLPAWKITNGVVSNIINVAVIIVMFYMAIISIDMFKTFCEGIAGMAEYNKENAEKEAVIEAERKEKNAKIVAQTDTSLNAISASRYEKVIVRAEPNEESGEVITIPSGVFFTKGKQSGKFTEVEYKGKKGWAVSKSIKDLNEGHTAIINFKDTYMGDSPNVPYLYAGNGKFIAKGTEVILLGERVNDYVKIHYKDKVGWVYWKYLNW